LANKGRSGSTNWLSSPHRTLKALSSPYSPDCREELISETYGASGHKKKGLTGEHGFLTLPLFLSPVKGTIPMFADQEADVTNVLVASFWRRALDAI
jgi:hypothetical protein